MASFMDFPTQREVVLTSGNTTIGVIPEIGLVSHFRAAADDPQLLAAQRWYLQGEGYVAAHSRLRAPAALDGHAAWRVGAHDEVAEQRCNAPQLSLRVYVYRHGCRKRGHADLHPDDGESRRRGDAHRAGLPSLFRRGTGGQGQDRHRRPTRL